MDERRTLELVSRRALLRGLGAVAGAGVVTGGFPTQAAALPARDQASSFFRIIRQPDAVWAFEEEGGLIPLQRSGTSWTTRGVSLTCEESADELRLALVAPAAAMMRLHLRWSFAVPAELRLLGDAWERSYGELGWRQIVPEQPMPWYFLASDGKAAHGLHTHFIADVESRESRFLLRLGFAPGFSLDREVSSMSSGRGFF